MTALSTKDKLKLRLSAAKVERWNRQRIVFANEGEEQRNPRYKDGTLKRCQHLESGGAIVEPETILPDKLDVLYRATDGVFMDLSAKKTLIRRGQNFSDYHDSDYSESPRDPAWKQGQAKVVTARPDSPFKRAKAKPVVVVRETKRA